MKIPLLARRRIGLGLLGAALLAALAFVALRSGPLTATRVTVVQAAEGRLAPALFGIGTVEARRSYLIGPTAAARVRAVAVDAGDAVRAGQLLAEMDPVDLDERKAALEASIARAGSAIAAAEAQRRDALARRELAAVNARRYVELGAQNFISAGAVEARLQEQASADAALSAAEANLGAARQDRQRLVAEQAGLSQQRANLRLLAPAAGVVTSRDAEPGSTVVAGQAVLRLIVPASLWVRVRLDQARSAGLAVGLPAQIVLRSHPGRAWPGKVARVEAVSDSVTEERLALVAFDALPPGLSVGELAEVTLALPPSERAVVLPNAAVKRVDGRTGVWTIEHDALRFAPVRLGAAGLDGEVQVLEGVRPGTTVVVHSEAELNAGRRVKVAASLAGAPR
ncbi:MAG: hemolysin D [Pseudomonadota bacterium]|nr:efflux RND transporter periplasmic adaptor subunit [Rubrivivax sp.]